MIARALGAQSPSDLLCSDIFLFIAYIIWFIVSCSLIGKCVFSFLITGKSLYVKRLHRIMERKLQEEVPLQAIRLIDTHIDEGKVLKSLLPFLDHQSQKRPMIFHFDITSSVSILQFWHEQQGERVCIHLLCAKPASFGAQLKLPIHFLHQIFRRQICEGAIF